MPTFEVCVTSTLEIYATIEAEDAEQAEYLARDIQTIDYANNTVGAEMDDEDNGTIDQVLGHGVQEVESVNEKGQ